LATISQQGYWPAGSDSDAIEGTRALPAAWSDYQGVVKIAGDFGAATTALAAVAGTGLEEMKAAMGPVGGACGACHKAYRKPQ
jgi:cytochrome c556